MQCIIQIVYALVQMSLVRSRGSYSRRSIGHKFGKYVQLIDEALTRDVRWANRHGAMREAVNALAG
jgi:hypothetical protein